MMSLRRHRRKVLKARRARGVRGRRGGAFQKSYINLVHMLLARRGDGGEIQELYHRLIIFPWY